MHKRIKTQQYEVVYFTILRICYYATIIWYETMYYPIFFICTYLHIILDSIDITQSRQIH
jgi:hypothetical protein